MEMMETRITKEKPPVVYDLDDYRRGLRNRANETEITITDLHKMNLWTIQAGQAVPLHMHTNSECIMIVLAGQGEYRQGDRSFDVKKDAMTVAPPGTAHGFRNTNIEPLVVLTIEGPGPFDAKVLEPMSGEKFY
jgi:mannose-6-phosphate isomerase-like protein (cupin superfamily)